jgi:hypothetical protein
MIAIKDNYHSSEGKFIKTKIDNHCWGFGFSAQHTQSNQLLMRYIINYFVNRGFTGWTPGFLCWLEDAEEIRTDEYED